MNQRSSFSANRCFSLSFWRVLATLFLLTMVLAACAPLKPYRTVDPNQKPIAAIAHAICPPQNISDWQNASSSTFGTVQDPKCDKSIEEQEPATPISAGYSLFFTEYDDKGQPFPDDEKYGDAHNEEAIFFRALTAMLNASQDDLSIVVFVHGWKDTADSHDSDVRWFRAVLHQLSVDETATKCHRKTVGVYVGWRGAGTALVNVPVLAVAEDFTFWNRKGAATRIANGQVRTFFENLNNVERNNNQTWNDEVAKWNSGELTPLEPCSKRVQTTYVGHSFGGLIVFSALSPAMTKDVVDLRQHINTAGRKKDPILQREGDLVIAINPALEATAFEPLFHAATDPKRGPTFGSYHAPMFVSITSRADWATGLAFPFARWFTTISQTYPGRRRYREFVAATKTIGHDQEFITHDLSVLSKDAYKQLSAKEIDDYGCSTLLPNSTFDARLAIEHDRLTGTIADLNLVGSDARELWTHARTFCTLWTDSFIGIQVGELQHFLALSPRPGINVNSPVWNVYTDHPILNSHTDLLNPLMLDFIRQLYEQETQPQLQVVKP